MYIEQLKSGDKFSKLKKTIAINILDFESLPVEKFHSSFHIIEDETGIKLTDVMEVHFLEMPKLYENQKLIMLDTITPAEILSEGHQKELTTYKGVMVSKSHAERDMFKINLLNSMNKNGFLNISKRALIILSSIVLIVIAVIIYLLVK